MENRYNVTGLQGNRLWLGAAINKYAPEDLASYLMGKDPWLESDILVAIQVLRSVKRPAAKYEIPKIIEFLKGFLPKTQDLLAREL